VHFGRRAVVINCGIETGVSSKGETSLKIIHDTIDTFIEERPCLREISCLWRHISEFLVDIGNNCQWHDGERKEEKTSTGYVIQIGGTSL